MVVLVPIRDIAFSKALRHRSLSMLLDTVQSNILRVCQSSPYPDTHAPPASIGT